jgi:HK97 family phage major capsid protein
MSNIKALRQRKVEANAKMRAMLDKLEAENRDFTEAESAEYESGIKALTTLESKIEREEKLLESERNMPVIGDGDEPRGKTGAKKNESDEEKKGFGTFGEFLKAVVISTRTQGARTDERLMTIQAAAAGMSETVPSDGGFLVQKDFTQEILKRMYQTGEILNRTRKIPISSNANGVKLNAVDESSRADGSRYGGVQAFWENEANTPAASKPKFRKVELNLEKLFALAYMTDELLQDTSALEAVVTDAITEELRFKTEDAIINGTGSGQPLGVLNSGSLITQAKDGGDSGATISTNDVLAMYSRLWVRSLPNAVWFIDQSIQRTLFTLTLGAPSLGQVLIYTLPGANGNKYATLMGLPVIPTEHGAALGTPGDIVLADMEQYILIDKGGPRVDSSMHVRFLTDEMTFRFIYRVDGQPWWNVPLTPKSGGPTQSPFLALATRS